MQVRACGCIPFKRLRTGELVALMVLKRGGHWEFPKGHKEEGESDEETALRELKEETALTGEITKEQPIDTTYTFVRDEVRTEKTVRYFFCRVPDEAQARVDGAEINDHVWLSLEDLSDRATYPEMKDVARRVHLTLGE